MSKKNHAPHPTPPGNQTTAGPGASNPADVEPDRGDQGAPFSEQDP